jgi:hypothetical protein
MSVIPILAGWLAMAVVASANGTFSKFVLKPRFGEYASHAYKSVVMVLVIFLIACVVMSLSVSRSWNMKPLVVGIMWFSLTVAFEFLAGHYLFGNSWDSLLADYRFWRGRLWSFVLLSSFIAPLIVSKIIPQHA